MKLWILDHYAGAPDQPAALAFDLSRQLVARGHQVTIFSSGFNHYSLREERCEGRRPWKVELHEGVRFVWLRTFPYRTNDWRRALNMLSYGLLAIALGTMWASRPDVIVGTCPHPLAALAASVLSRRWRCRFLYQINDPWPQILVDMGRIREDHLFTKALHRLERYLLRSADQIITPWRHLDEYAGTFGLEKRIVFIPNGGDLRRYEALHPYDGGGTGRFTVVYLGGHSPYHGLDVILHAAKILQNHERDVRFVLVGDGMEKPRLVRLAEELALGNVEFRPMLPRHHLGSVMEEADAFIYVLRDIGGMRYGSSPTKMVDYLASGRPVIYSARTRDDPVAEAGAGISVDPESPLALADGIRRLLSLGPQERAEMGRRGAEYARRHYDARVLAARLEEAVLELPA